MTDEVELEAMRLAAHTSPIWIKTLVRRRELLRWRGLSICSWQNVATTIGFFTDSGHRFTIGYGDDWVRAAQQAFWSQFFNRKYAYTEKPDSIDGIPWAIHGIRNFNAYQTALDAFRQDRGL